MRFVDFTLQDGFFRRAITFSEIANLIYSDNNSVGKTTFLRAMFYALGYPVPSTRGIKFNDMEFWLTFDGSNRRYKLYRHDSYLSVEDDYEIVEYSLPSDFSKVQAQITGCENKNILDNLLGASYMDQEKGWTLLNRGKVVGSISFNIEALVRGLGNVDCEDKLAQLEAVEHQLKKYKYMFSVAEYQNTIHEAEGDVDYNAPDEILIREIECLRAEKEPLDRELRQIKNILRRNKLLAEYITEMKLTVQTPSGEEIPVTRDSLVGFEDNDKFLIAHREMLAADLENLNRKISVLERQMNREKQRLEVQTIIEAFDSDIKKINVDAIATKKIIDHLKKEQKGLREQIRFMTKENNTIVDELHDCIRKYAIELGVDEKYVSPNKDYIFTNDLKSLSGAILHKIVFSFKMAYIKLIREKAGIVLPIVLDSPTGREVKFSTVQKMLQIVQRDYAEHQLIVASIHNYDLMGKKTIEFRNRLFDSTDIFI